MANALKWQRGNIYIWNRNKSKAAGWFNQSIKKKKQRHGFRSKRNRLSKEYFLKVILGNGDKHKVL